MLRLGSQNISALYLGGQEIKRAYLGDALVFDSAPAVRTYTITASIDPSGAGTVTGAGQYKEGESVTIRAVPGDGYKFTGWRENGVAVSTNEAYTFTVTRDMEFTAVFEAKITRLPAGYQEVEYISNPNLGYIYNNSSSAWIGRLPFTNTRVEISIKLPAKPSDGYFFGNSYINYSGTAMTKYSSNFIGYVSSSNKIRADSGTKSYTLNAISGIMDIVVDTPKGIFSVNKSSTTITSVSTVSDSGYLPVPAIFSRNYSRTGTSPSTTYGSGAMNFYLYSLKIYSSTATETGDLAFDFVPCINPSGLVGIYDVVHKSFWRSSVASKPFVAGPAV